MAGEENEDLIKAYNEAMTLGIDHDRPKVWFNVAGMDSFSILGDENQYKNTLCSLVNTILLQHVN